jgi:hypothetical protein
MSVTDFLFQGKAPPSVNTYGTTTANIPQWLSDYTQGLLAKGNAVAAFARPRDLLGRLGEAALRVSLRAWPAHVDHDRHVGDTLVAGCISVHVTPRPAQFV